MSTNKRVCIQLTAIVAVVGMGSGGLLPSAGAANRRASAPVVSVVAAENFWGSIATQIGGRAVSVTSVITNPNTDPHEYEPSARDARTIATASLVIENGIGYDPWMTKLLAADGSGATVLNVGITLGLGDGANPHRWYNPANVTTVVSTIVADLSKIDPGGAAGFRANAQRFELQGLATYHALISQIRARYSGTPVGASESIFAMLSPALGLDLITPPTFLRAISEGTDVSASDKSTIDRQIATHRIKIYVYNSQNATPDVASQIAACRKAGIPLATITETLSPSGATYQAWQASELRGILAALEHASKT